MTEKEFEKTFDRLLNNLDLNDEDILPKGSQFLSDVEQFSQASSSGYFKARKFFVQFEEGERLSLQGLTDVVFIDLVKKAKGNVEDLEKLRSLYLCLFPVQVREFRQFAKNLLAKDQAVSLGVKPLFILLNSMFVKQNLIAFLRKNYSSELKTIAASLNNYKSDAEMILKQINASGSAGANVGSINQYIEKKRQEFIESFNHLLKDSGFFNPKAAELFLKDLSHRDFFKVVIEMIDTILSFNTSDTTRQHILALAKSLDGPYNRRARFLYDLLALLKIDGYPNEKEMLDKNLVADMSSEINDFKKARVRKFFK